MRSITHIIGGLFLACFCLTLQAQDLHFSMYHNAPLNINPALTGIFSGNHRFAVSHRRQWYSVPVEYMTFTGSYDGKLKRCGASSWFSVGGLFNYDEVGDSELSTTFLGISGSYTFGFSPNVLLTAGAMAGGNLRSFNSGGLTWDNYWDGTIVDQNRGSGEPGSFDDNLFYFDLSGGLNLRLQESSRTRLDIGGAIFHLNQPRASFYDDDNSDLPMRFNINLNGSLRIFNNIDLIGQGMMQFMGPYQEILFGGLLNFHLSTKKAREVQFMVGIGTRLDDAIIPQVGLVYDGWQANFSYDINTSAFDIATDQRGGPEFSLIYRITKVCPDPQAKICRIF